MESAQADDARAGMGTTLTVAYVGEDDLTVAHVGDSRLYRLRDGTFERLTDDHSLVEELVRQGKLTPEEADEHPQRSIITRALGAEEGVEADSRTWAGRDGDVYLICSDGLTSMIPEAHVAEVLAEAPSLAERRAHAHRRGQRRRRARQHHRRPLPPGGGRRRRRRAAGRRAEHRAAARARAGDGRGGAGHRRPWRGCEPRPAAPRAPRRAGAGAGARASRSARSSSSSSSPACSLGGYYASQTVYFVGASDDGFVTRLPRTAVRPAGGPDLYSVNYESGAPVDELTPAQRRTVTAHKLRSKDDAQDLVRQLETGAAGGAMKRPQPRAARRWSRRRCC